MWVCAGALVGPPWSKRENGFLFTEQVDGGMSLYYEPHCDYDESSLAGIQSVDVVITPTVNQELMSYPLVNIYALDASMLLCTLCTKLEFMPLRTAIIAMTEDHGRWHV